MVLAVENPLAMQEMQVQFLVREDSPPHHHPPSTPLPARVGNGNPLQVFLPGKFHRQRSLAGYSPWGCKGSDMTEHTPTHTMSLPWRDSCIQSRLSGPLSSGNIFHRPRYHTIHKKPSDKLVTRAESWTHSNWLLSLTSLARGVGGDSVPDLHSAMSQITHRAEIGMTNLRKILNIFTFLQNGVTKEATASGNVLTVMNSYAT